MKRNIFPAVFLMAVITVAGCSMKNHDDDRKAVMPADVVRGARIQTVRVLPVPETLEVVGTVRARTSAVVSARISGVTCFLKVREGDRVRKGQLLLQLDAKENQAAAAVAAAGVDESEHALDEARSRKKLADITFERYQKLFNEQAVSRQEFDVKQTEKDVASQSVFRAESRFRQAQEGSRASSSIAAYTRIYAPISGIVTARQADTGSTVFPSQQLMTIEDEESYRLELSVPELYAPSVKPGTAVRVTLDALKSAFDAKITEIVPSADNGSRTFIAKIALGQKGLTSGMFGRGAISLGTGINRMLIPKKAIVERGSLTLVWVVGKDAVTHMRLVKTGASVGNTTEILSGLSDGDRILADGSVKVGEGAKVE